MKNKPTLTSNGTRKKVREYLAATQAKNTQLAYQNDLAHFLRSGGKIPATPSSVASYLAIHAQTLSIATLNRRIVAIGRAHTGITDTIYVGDKYPTRNSAYQWRCATPSDAIVKNGHG